MDDEMEKRKWQHKDVMITDQAKMNQRKKLQSKIQDLQKIKYNIDEIVYSREREVDEDDDV